LRKNHVGVPKLGLGLFTRPAALALAVNMLVAALKVHLANGFFLDLTGAADGVEYVFVLILISLYFTVKGAGLVSLDKIIFDRIQRSLHQNSAAGKISPEM
jgi:putative oxidoreductase